MRTLLLAAVLLAVPNLARAWGPILGAESAYISPGAIISKNWRENEGWAFGLELSALVMRPSWLTLGVLTQWQHESGAERFMVGVEAAAFVGGELGLALRKPHRDDVELGLHSALFFSVGVFHIGPRLVFWRDGGVETGLVLGGKLPIVRKGSYFFEPANTTWALQEGKGPAQ